MLSDLLHKLPLMFTKAEKAKRMRPAGGHLLLNHAGFHSGMRRRQKSILMGISMKKFFIFLLAPVLLMGQAYIQRDTESLTLGNNHFEARFSIKARKAKLDYLYNKDSGQRYGFKGDFFRITTTYLGEGITPPRNTPAKWSMQDFVLQDIRQTGKGNNQQALLIFEGHSLKITLRLNVPSQEPWFKINLELSPFNDVPVFIERVHVFDGKLMGLQTSHGGFGQPLYGDDLFFGIEFPGAYSESGGGDHVSCWYRLAQKLSVKKPLYTYPAVIGFAPSGRTQETFFGYIRTLRPRNDEPFVLYNTWYDVRDFSYDKLLSTIQAFKSTLIDRYGLTLDAFVIDDGWDDVHSVWELNRQKFPQGFAPLRRELEKMNSRLGLWISPWNGYGSARDKRVRWAGEHGYKTSGRHLCLGEDRYFNTFKNKTLQYLKEGDLSFYKIDGFLSICNESDHDHLPGIYSRTTLIERLIEILKALRAEKPDIFIDITVGTWLSPWWLQYADAVWMTGADYGHAEEVPAFSERDKAITFRDYTLYKDFVVNQFQFPLSNVMTHGIIKGKLNLLGGKNETLRDWMNNVVMYFSRGVMMWELYLSPEILSKEEWGFLAATMKWAHRNHKTLSNTVFLGGDPYQRKIYGYLHKGEDRSILILRNPFVQPQTISFEFARLFGKKEKRAFMVETLYPQRSIKGEPLRPGQPLSFNLQGYEVLVLQFKPISDTQPLYLSGAVLQPLKQTENSATYELYWDATMPHAPRLVNKSKIKRLIFNGQDLSVSAFESLLQNWSATQQKRTSPRLCFNALDRQQISGSVELGKDTLWYDARLGFLLDFSEAVKSLRIEFKMGERTVKPIVKKGAAGRWYWILLPMDDLQQPVAFHIQNEVDEPLPPANFSIWEMGMKKLVKMGKLTIKSKENVFEKENDIPTVSKGKWQTRPLFKGKF
ncbi:hypothetical protein Calab_2819 [Caldithrix abyssi DSM 13497]|uniref:Alpha-galactosidase n=3 Tax=Caldithrix abyssi TaxID=187145 RepID=H1XRE5_CALAY|nr:hypothetical protein Calab_2819 [Caldithrix abyssi DSM 13497]